MVAGREEIGELLKEVQQLYLWLDKQIDNSNVSKSLCRACGDCCNFDAFDHRLFVTTPELIYFTANLNDESPKKMPAGICPYNIKGKCTVYEYRFAGCRIFCCGGDADFQSKLSETVSRMLKDICNKYDVPYQYRDMKKALNESSAD